MTTLSKIRIHSTWVYRGILLLLTGAVLSNAYVLLVAAGRADETLASAARLSALPLGLACLAVIYLRRNISFSLAQAATSEAEKHRRLKIDDLTGAFTRRHFMEELNAAVGTFRDARSATLLLLDVDHFKHLNDTYGHAIGDQALARFVALARAAFPDGIVGRLGGDEFAIILPGADTEALIAETETFLASLRRPQVFDTCHVALSASIGIAMAPRHTTLVSDLLVLADLALYESKAAGRGRATVFDGDMLSDQRQRRFMERELRSAIMLNELELHYQPIVDAARAFRGVEALLRWNHQYRGQISPAQFIPVAERSNLIDGLGEWVFRRACADLGDLPEDCRISINVSGAQLRRDTVVTMIARVLEETGRSADRFVLEITETAATSATPEVMKRLEALRAMGFRIALDDFGTGHCGLNYLTSLPIDVIKIDRSYVQALGRDPVAQVLVSALAQIARIKNLAIVAEGVETDAEMDLARLSGCNRFQGYHVCRPVPKPALKTWLASHHQSSLPAAPAQAVKGATAALLKAMPAAAATG